MLRRAIVALKLTDDIPTMEGDFFGADVGAVALARKGLRMKMALGDFDSIEDGAMELIKAHADEVRVLNPIKDDTDSEAMVRYVVSLGYNDIILIGGLGSRMDHTLVNIRLTVAFCGLVSLWDSRNFIKAYGAGRHVIEKNGWKYMSLFTEERAIVSLDGVRYPLAKKEVTYRDLYTSSNEILSTSCVLTVHEGVVIIMQCRD